MTEVKALQFVSVQRPTSCRLSTVAGWDGHQPVRENRSLSGTGGGEEESLGAGGGTREEESPGERGGAEEGRRGGEDAEVSVDTTSSC